VKPIESARIAWRAITGHKLRSTLTTLGVIIGIGAVITFVTLGSGLQAGILGDVSPDDRTSVYTWAATPDNADEGPLSGAKPVFTQRDTNELAALDGIEAAHVFTQVPTQELVYDGETLPRDSGVVATGREYLDPEAIREGQRFRMGTREAVVNPAFAGQFDRNISVGDTVGVVVGGGVVSARRINVTVVGILEDSESRSALEGFNPAPRLYVASDVPVLDRFGNETVRYQALIVEASSQSESDVDRTKRVAREYLNSSASDASDRAGPDADLVFIMKTSTELLGQLEDILTLFQNFIVGIAGISLLVGSIGIANIMLVSVTERTREIGIMKAVGAQRRDVMGLFMIEAVIIGLIGAVLGTIAGLVAGYLLADFIGIPWVVPWDWATVAVVVGLLVGVLAGIYPAWNAARTDPIDALRYE